MVWACIEKRRRIRRQESDDDDGGAWEVKERKMWLDKISDDLSREEAQDRGKPPPWPSG